jgi:hypothetical protein
VPQPERNETESDVINPGFTEFSPLEIGWVLDEPGKQRQNPNWMLIKKTNAREGR